MIKRPRTKKQVEKLGPGYLRLSDVAENWAKCAELRKAAPELLDLLDEIDRTKEPGLLLPLLNIPPEAQPHFKDLFERLVFTSRSSRIPSYRPSDHQQKLFAAKFEVDNRALFSPGVKKAEAITDAARYWGINRSALELFCEGRHASGRQAKRPPPSR